MIQNINDASFKKEVLDSDIPVLVDIWASWCGPCIALGPVIEQAAKKYEGKIKVAKLNIDENSQTPSEFGVRNIPTLLFFKNGKLVDQHVGTILLDQLSTKIDQLFNIS